MFIVYGSLMHAQVFSAIFCLQVGISNLITSKACSIHSDICNMCSNKLILTLGLSALDSKTVLQMSVLGSQILNVLSHSRHLSVVSVLSDCLL